MRKQYVFALLLLALAGCNPEPRYEGRSAESWRAQLKSPDPMGRCRAAAALAIIGPPTARRAIPDLIPLLSDSEYFVRYEAAAALGRFGPASRRAVPELLKMLKDQNAQVRGAAARALKSIDPETADEAGVPND
jgi:HEAT repeat protein